MKAQKTAVVANVRLLASPLARLAVVLQISLARTQISKTCSSCERRLYGGVFYGMSGMLQSGNFIMALTLRERKKCISLPLRRIGLHKIENDTLL